MGKSPAKDGKPDANPLFENSPTRAEDGRATSPALSSSGRSPLSGGRSPSPEKRGGLRTRAGQAVARKNPLFAKPTAGGRHNSRKSAFHRNNKPHNPSPSHSSIFEKSQLHQEVEKHNAGEGLSHKAIWHLASQLERDTRIEPEMLESARLESGQDKHNLGREIWRWTHTDMDMPADLQIEESNHRARVELETHYLLDPDGPFRQGWDLIQMLLLVYMAFDLPVNVGFDEQAPPLWSSDFFSNVAVDLYFAIDIVLSFVTCIKDDRGLLVTEQKVIVAEYTALKTGWFSVDVVSVLPVGYIGYFVEKQSSGSSTKIVKLLRLLRLTKLLRLARLKRLIKKYDTHFHSMMIKLRGVRLVVFILVMSHWVACLWFFFGVDDDGAGWVASWAEPFFKENYDMHVNATTLADPVQRAAIFGDLYLVTYFQATLSLISGGYPQYSDTLKREEMLFSVLSICFGGFLFGTIIGSITELVRKNNMESNIVETRNAEARAICRDRADEFLTAKIMEQVRFHLSHESPLNALPFLDSLTGNLSMEFAAQLNWVPKCNGHLKQYGMLHKVPFFSLLDHYSKMLICSKLKIVAFDAFDPDNLSPLVPSRQMTVEGEAGSDMFIVLSGTIAVVKQHKVIGELKTHNFFGELAILRPHRVDSFGQLHTRTHYAIEDSVVAALGYEDFQQLRIDRPEINDAVLPYIKEACLYEVKPDQWLFIELIGAEGLIASDVGGMKGIVAEDNLSDPFCMISLGNEKTDLWNPIGTTKVCMKDLNPVWKKTMAISRKELANPGAMLKMEVYDYDQIAENDFLGEVSISLKELYDKTHTRISQFKHNKMGDEVMMIPLRDPKQRVYFGAGGGESGESGRAIDSVDSTKNGAIDADLLNEGYGKLSLQRSDTFNAATSDDVDIHTRDPRLMEEQERRRKAHVRRFVATSDELAELAELKEEMAELKQGQAEILELLRKK